MRNSFYIALLACLATGTKPTVVEAQVDAKPLPASAVAQLHSRLSPSLIPQLDGDFELDPHQSFTVQSTGFPTFIMLPAHFRSSSDDAPGAASRCGIFFIAGGASITFLGTLGFDNREPELCDDLLGVGFMPMPSGPPRIILLYDGGSFNSPGKDPVILDWNPALKRYASNDQVAQKLRDVTTVPAIRDQLKAAKP